MGIEIFGSSNNKVAQESRLISYEEARKRGLTAPGGIFNLLGELDYYRLIEKLIRGPITESQLITPFRFWFFSKGMTFASFMAFLSLLIRFSLLTTGANVDYSFKYSVFVATKAFLLYANFDILIGYITYPEGAAYSAVRYSLIGYTVGILSSELLFYLVAIASLFFRPFVESNWYGKWKILDAVLETWYNFFIGSGIDETASLFLAVIICFCGWYKFKRIVEKRRIEWTRGRPYEILES